jgi:hypothetical protein
VAAREVGLQQGVAVGPQPGASQGVGARGDHGLALVPVRDLPVEALHRVAGLAHQRRWQVGLQRVARLAQAGELDAADQRAQPVAARQGCVSLQPGQRRVVALGQRAAFGSVFGGQHLDDVGHLCREHVHLRPRK